MFLFCWLFGHVFERVDHDVTEVTCDGVVTHHETRVMQFAGCDRCGKLSPSFLRSQSEWPLPRFDLNRELSDDDMGERARRIIQKMKALGIWEEPS